MHQVNNNALNKPRNYDISAPDVTKKDLLTLQQQLLGVYNSTLNKPTNRITDKPETTKKDLITINNYIQQMNAIIKKGIAFDETIQNEKGTQLKFKTDKAVKLIVGYFNTDQKRFLLPPNLETDASGNSNGQAEVILANAINLKELPRVNIHTYMFPVGEHELKLGKGKVLLLGFIDANQAISPRDVGFIGAEDKGAIDWLFY
mgnify:CR=1 FL=1